MAADQEMPEAGAPTSEERLWGALSWIPATPLWPILAIVALVMESTKDSEYVRHHAILSLTTGLVLIPMRARAPARPPP